MIPRERRAARPRTARRMIVGAKTSSHASFFYLRNFPFAFAVWRKTLRNRQSSDILCVLTNVPKTTLPVLIILWTTKSKSLKHTLYDSLTNLKIENGIIFSKICQIPIRKINLVSMDALKISWGLKKLQQANLKKLSRQ